MAKMSQTASNTKRTQEINEPMEWGPANPQELGSPHEPALEQCREISKFTPIATVVTAGLPRPLTAL